MTRSVLALSRMIAVHARGAVDELAGVEPVAAIEYVALGEGRAEPCTEAERRDARRALGLADAQIAFGVFGALTAEKRLPQILRAFAATHARVPDTVLVAAGSADVSVDVAALAAQLGIADAIRLPGPPDDEAFDTAIAAVDVSLNLRWPSALEMSGPWLRALAAARPTVIVDLPHLGHLPTLDPRSWRLHAPALPPGADRDAVAAAVDILDEEHSLRLAMHRLATDATLRDALGRSGRRYWESAHTVDRMVDDVDRVLAAAASRPAPAPALPAALTPDPFALARRLLDPFGAAAIGVLADLTPAGAGSGGSGSRT
jgi:glycosyltransferase involved in cell wall biosynthesis